MTHPKYPKLFLDNDEHVEKLELEELISFRTKGARLRCQANWLEGGQKCSKDFFNLEKHNYNHKTISRLCNEKGQIIETQDLILSEQRDFSKNLLSGTNSKADAWRMPQP